MWHKVLENNLLDIFQMEKILYGTPLFGKEQDVLFCTLGSVVPKVRTGEEIAEINGTIAIIGLLTENKSGYLSKRIQLSEAKKLKGFHFYREETPITIANFEERFNVYSIGFTFFYKSEFNPVNKFIDTLNLIIQKTTNFIKGV